MLSVVELVGTVVPLTATTTVEPCVPVTCPARVPVKLPALPLVFPVTLPVRFPLKVPDVVPARVIPDGKESVTVPVGLLTVIVELPTIVVGNAVQL